MIEKDNYLPKGHRNRPGNSMKPQGILFHTTNNWSDGSGDELHGEYMVNVKDRVVSWHDTVDKDSITHHIPYNENAWHAGDGMNGKYNRNWIGVEIACEAVEPGEPLDKETYNNAVLHIAKLMAQFAFDWDRLQPHNVVYGKDCPHHTLFDRMEFKKDVIKKMEELKKQGQQPKPQPKTRFTDVPAGHWAEDVINVVDRANIMKGYDDGTFGLGKTVTREELAKVVNELLWRMSEGR